MRKLKLRKINALPETVNGRAKIRSHVCLSQGLRTLPWQKWQGRGRDYPAFTEPCFLSLLDTELGYISHLPLCLQVVRWLSCGHWNMSGSDTVSLQMQAIFLLSLCSFCRQDAEVSSRGLQCLTKCHSHRVKGVQAPEYKRSPPPAQTHKCTLTYMRYKLLN